MQLRTVRPWLVFGVVFLAIAATGRFAEESYSANMTNVSATLSNSRLSFKGGLAAGNTVGSSQIKIATSGYPSVATTQLQNSDTVIIGEGGSMASHTITEIVDADDFTIGTVLATGDADTGDDVISSQSSEINVDFTTVTAVADGKFQVLLPAETTSNIAKDGIPDSGFFDFTYQLDTTATKALVTCPANTGNYAFNETDANATASAVTLSGLYYHVYECGYSGAGGVGTTINDFKIVNVINPAPKSGHAAGTADTYKPIIRQLNNTGTVIDQTTVSIGVIEAVRVTATVAPQITFSIAGIAASTADRCGITTDATTTETSVPFGELSIAAFLQAAQEFTVSTNAADGYAVTAIENDQLSRNNATCTTDGSSNTDCLIDSAGDDNLMSHTNPDDWSSTAKPGFGYTLENVDAAYVNAMEFEFDGTQGSCGGGVDCYKQFADAQDSQSVERMFSSNDVASAETVYVCYQANISATQAAGNYENYITYTATANF
ncbi:MAG: hypothetical protein O2840_03085 [bacterium]|nr:hypothetical protein [bacterium]